MKRFYIYLVDSDITTLEVEINRKVDGGFDIHGFLVFANGKYHQCMSKLIDEDASAVKSYEAFHFTKRQRPFNPPPPFPNG